MTTYTSADHSFVVCAYGKSPYLGECLSSLRKQRVGSRIILSTSTPSDYISSVADQYEVPVFVSREAPGIADDWNRALALVDTSLATIAHQDDAYLPEYTATMLDCVNRAKDPLIFFSDYGEIREGSMVESNTLLRVKRAMLRPLVSQHAWKSRRLRRAVLSLGSPICCPSVTYNLDLLERPIFVTGFKSDLDWQAWEKLSRLDGSFVYSNQILMGHRIHAGSETSNLIHDETRTQEDLEMLSRFWPRPIARLINRLYSKSQSSNG